jgi:FkbM family methyltransferase
MQTKNMKTIIKRLYSLIPFKILLYKALRQIHVPSFYHHLHFNGIIDVPINDATEFKMIHYGYYIENEVFWRGLYGGWEKYSLKLWTELSKESTMIFDIGANTGIFGLISNAINSKSEIHYFEPVKRVYDKLLTNDGINNFNNKVINKAVSDNSGVAIIFDKKTSHTYSVTVNKDISPDSSDSIEVQIDTIRLDEYIEKNNIQQIDLMKIDVETHEFEALQGMGKYLDAFKPSLLIEILNNTVAINIEKLIEGMGYEYYNIHEVNGIKKVVNLQNQEHRNFLICQPSVSKRIEILNIVI